MGKIISKIPKKEKTKPAGTKKKFQSRKVKFILCCLVVFILAFGAIPMLYSQQAETETVIVVKNSIAKGAEIKSTDIMQKTIGTYGLTGEYIVDKNKIIGKIAKVDMVAGDLVYESKIGDYSTDPVIDSFTKDGKGLVTVTVKTNAAGLASHIDKGDYLKVWCIRDYYDGYSDVSEVVENPILASLEVYDIENSDTDSVATKKKDANTDKKIATITFIANNEQIKALLEFEYTGNIHASFVGRGGDGIE